jgi:ABC-type glycerol-3-phosphate transport system permease component
VSGRLRAAPTHAVLLAGGLVMIFPLYWMVATSLKFPDQINRFPPVWIPSPVNWSSYPEALASRPFGLWFSNTFLIAALVIVGELLSSSFVAYGFARLRFPGRDVLFMLLISTLMVPLIVRLIPLFILFKQLGWVNTFLPLIVPSFFGTPLFVFLMRQFFLTIPLELSDAARVDGANELQIWWRIILPLSGPVMAVVAIFAFQNTWNDFLIPLIFLNDNAKKTAALGLATMMAQVGLDFQRWDWMMAVATTMVAPMVALFVLTQRYFVQGVALTGLKG